MRYIAIRPGTRFKQSPELVLLNAFELVTVLYDGGCLLFLRFWRRLSLELPVGWPTLSPAFGEEWGICTDAQQLCDGIHSPKQVSAGKAKGNLMGPAFRGRRNDYHAHTTIHRPVF